MGFAYFTSNDAPRTGPHPGRFGFGRKARFSEFVAQTRERKRLALGLRRIPETSLVEWRSHCACAFDLATVDFRTDGLFPDVSSHRLRSNRPRSRGLVDLAMDCRCSKPKRLEARSRVLAKRLGFSRALGGELILAGKGLAIKVAVAHLMFYCGSGSGF